jgi:hypothetical protein
VLTETRVRSIHAESVVVGDDHALSSDIQPTSTQSGHAAFPQSGCLTTIGACRYASELKLENWCWGANPASVAYANMRGFAARLQMSSGIRLKIRGVPLPFRALLAPLRHAHPESRAKPSGKCAQRRKTHQRSNFRQRPIAAIKMSRHEFNAHRIDNR